MLTKMMSKIDMKKGKERHKIKTHFARIIVSFGIDDPYYSILYYDPADDEFHQGFGSRCFDNVFKWLSEKFEIVGDVFFCKPVRHGRWNKPAYAAQDWIWRCSACKGCTEFIAANVFYKYCPWCGAKMDGGA